MKILVTVHDSISPVTGGGALRTIKVAAELKKRGHEVVILAPSEELVVGGVKVIPLPLPDKSDLLKSSVKFNAVLFKKLLSLSGKFDLIFSHSIVSGFLCFLFCRFYGKKFVFDITDLHTEYFKVNNSSEFLKPVAWVLNFIEYFTARKSDSVIAVTNVMKNWLVKKGVPDEKIRVVYDGVEYSNYSPDKDGSGLNVIHIGEVEKGEGIETLIRAIPLILRKLPNARFYFIGGGVDFEEMKNLSRILKVSDNCVFTGLINYSRVRDYMKKSQISVISRPPTPANHTVLTLKLLEAWASGTVCVSTPLEGIREIADENEDVVFYEPDSPASLAEKIIYLFERPEVLVKMRLKGREKARNFDWSPLINKICDIVENEMGNSVFSVVAKNK